jgi:sulfatase modifying factor 1
MLAWRFDEYLGDFRHVVAWDRLDADRQNARSSPKVGNRRERRIVLPFSSPNWKFRIMSLSVIVAALTAVLHAAPGESSKANPRDGLIYQWILPGSYFTGCLPGDRECYGLERHREKIVVANGFWIGRTEVTQAAYKRVMNTAPSFYKGEDLPADRVGWTDATAYCSRIGMRLPTESEWEWAAYGGTAEMPKEPVGSLAWCDPNSNDTTHPVATKLPNGFGLWDMLGNVWEWVQDAGKEPGEHILKGGSFYNSARDVRVSGRLSAPPDLRHRDIGFRCASSAWPEEKSLEGRATHQ